MCSLNVSTRFLSQVLDFSAFVSGFIAQDREMIWGQLMHFGLFEEYLE